MSIIWARDIEFSRAQVNPFVSLANILAFSSRDWAERREDAWIYGIVCGWGDAIGEVASRHNWDSNSVRRLRMLHLAFRRSEVHSADFGNLPVPSPVEKKE